MNYSNIKNCNQRQFDVTMKRECITVSDYYDSTKTYDVFFRRSRRGSNPQGKVRIYFSQDTPIDIGTTFVLKDKSYVVTSRDGDESDIFYTSMAVKCDTSFTVKVDDKYVSVPVVTLSDKYTLSGNSSISMVSGAVVVYTGDNLYSREVEVNENYYNYGGYYKVGNTFYNNGLAYIYMEREAEPETDTYELVYNGKTFINKFTANTYQLSYTALKNGVIVDNPPLTYSSYDTSIATVDENGLMTLLSNGSVKIAATWGNSICETDFNIISSEANYFIKITASSDTIRQGGSYNTLTLKFYDADGTDITDTTIVDMTRDDFVWTCSIDGVDFTNDTDVITWYNSSSNQVNMIRIKMSYAGDEYLTKTLDISCEVGGVKTSKDFEITF